MNFVVARTDVDCVGIFFFFANNWKECDENKSSTILGVWKLFYQNRYLAKERRHIAIKSFAIVFVKSVLEISEKFCYVIEMGWRGAGNPPSWKLIAFTEIGHTVSSLSEH